MADLTVTTSQVVPTANALLEHGVAGEALNPGESVYKSSADGKWYKADADAESTAGNPPAVTVNGADAVDQRITVQRGGTITMGAAAGVTAGAVYAVSATAGGIAPIGDLTTGKYVSILGVGDASNGIKLQPFASGIAVA